MDDRGGGDNNDQGRTPRSSNNIRGRNHRKRSRSSKGEGSFHRNGKGNGGYSGSSNASAEHSPKHQKPSPPPPPPRKPPPRHSHENHVKNHGQAHKRRNFGHGNHFQPTAAAAVNETSIQIPPALLNTASVANTTAILQWQTRHAHVPIQSEEQILNILMRWKKRERGMMRNAGNRYQEIARACQQVNMQLPQALSLRRQHMQHLNPHVRMAALGLGKDEDIRESAALFESAVEAYLNQCKVSFLTEAQQKASLPKGAKHPPSPDFMLRQPTLLSTSAPVQYSRQHVVQDYVIYWVEVKMFYAASTLAVNSKSAVGCILQKAQKYVSLYGTGAMVFMYGCGKEIADMLLERGVVALDAHPVDSRNVEAHQQTWCANKNGMILP